MSLMSDDASALRQTTPRSPFEASRSVNVIWSGGPAGDCVTEAAATGVRVAALWGSTAAATPQMPCDDAPPSAAGAPPGSSTSEGCRSRRRVSPEIPTDSRVCAESAPAYMAHGGAVVRGLRRGILQISLADRIAPLNFAVGLGLDRVLGLGLRLNLGRDLRVRGARGRSHARQARQEEADLVIGVSPRFPQHARSLVQAVALLVNVDEGILDHPGMLHVVDVAAVSLPVGLGNDRHDFPRDCKKRTNFGWF
eukprot:CAMPEP_0177283516 /NCGR_PEP_ID=MMETSP0367-20130122/72035_1 /TAXON_ID=447022 ORGANISM="Scrippsiella hangoei-like, Strain SHHI-4" /NCGR_SAMPLE_ID=MMETSP0367 /ASSEMBLY_ACC=CAM_ASM_000362 /LENGTH=251 /DNA_ID=CAMNT_0018740509 /DNA_START=302 /DNA_END=1058 /DNA_ORIENTATION=+